MKKCLALFLTMIFFASNVSFAIVTDNFVEETLSKNLKTVEYKKQIIKDELITEKFINEHKNETYKLSVYIVDDLANKNLSQYKNVKLVSYVPVNFQNLQKVSLKIKPKKYITTRNRALKEGTSLTFVLAEDFSYNNTLYKKGTELNARVENISQNQAFGTPANLEVGNFKIGNDFLDGTLQRKGANRAVWVVPVGYVGCCFLGAGLLILPIRGGHAKLNKGKTYTLIINSLSWKICSLD